MDFQEVGWGSMDCIDLTEYGDGRRTLVDAVMNFGVSYSSVNFLTIFSERTLLHGVSYYKCFYFEVFNMNITIQKLSVNQNSSQIIQHPCLFLSC